MYLDCNCSTSSTFWLNNLEFLDLVTVDQCHCQCVTLTHILGAQIKPYDLVYDLPEFKCTVIINIILLSSVLVKC